MPTPEVTNKGKQVVLTVQDEEEDSWDESDDIELVSPEKP